MIRKEANKVGQEKIAKTSAAYYEAVLETIKEYLPADVWKEIQRIAIPAAGGKANAQRISKLQLEEMIPQVLREAPDTEIRAAWRRLNQWYVAAKKERRAVENIINAAIWVSGEMEKRDIEIDETKDLYKAMMKFKNSKQGTITHRFSNLPKELMVVRDFISIVGSAVKGKKDPDDIDILFRANLDGDNYLIQSENVWLPVRNIMDPAKENILHFIPNAQGPHGDFISMYDLVLRRKPMFKKEIVKEASAMPEWQAHMKGAPDGLKVELGCGDSKADGFMGIDMEPFDGVDIVVDLAEGIPLQSETVAVLRANHFIEHIDDANKTMEEIHRCLMPGGIAIITVPSTKGDGAFAHPDHKTFWNKSSFDFWSNPELLEGRSQFECVYLKERDEGDLCYVDAVLKKPMAITKQLPLERFEPPKPQMAGVTEAFKIDEVLKWAENRWPIAIEPKHNGFRSIISKKGDQVEMWFEGQIGTDQLHKIPAIQTALKAIPGDFVADADLGIVKGGARLSRPALMKFNADKPVFEEKEVPVLTLFDLPYWKEHLGEKPFKDRRKSLEQFYTGIKDKKTILLSPIRWTDNETEMKATARWAFNQDASEGLVGKSSEGKYEAGGTREWFKLKRIVELKVIVLDKKETKVKGIYNYWGGLVPSEGNEWTNKTELAGKEYINLGKTFSTKIKANKGDILTVSILELIPDKEKKKLAWLGPTVLDIDKTRKEPYATSQAIDLARRGKVLQKIIKAIVPGVGKKGAVIAFVGASPGSVEAARGESLVGPSGETFNELYLKPLRLTRDQVFITNVVPEYLTDENGKVREPDADEIKKWQDWLNKELEWADANLVVALGRTAKKVMGDRAQYVLPHPMAIRRFGNKGELTRKLKQIKVAIKKQRRLGEEGEEKGPRARAADTFWDENWQDMYPPDGKGEFTYQHHWRGLSEEETKKSDKQLLETDHSVHGDLRFTTDRNGLWGFSVFLGRTADNRKQPSGDRLIDLPPDDNLQGTFKLQQPKQWLTVARTKPFVSEPGGVGATPETWSKFFEVDNGTYEMGVWREHLFEIFLKGKELKERFLIQYAPITEGRRVWIIDRPKDQTPYAEKRELDEVISELKQKGQKWLIWTKPGEKPQRIDVDKYKIKKEYYAEILKADNEKQIVTGIVLEPETIDAHGDIISAEEIEKASYFFMQKSRTIGERHKKKAQAEVIESYIAPTNLEIGEQKVKKGTWIISVKITDQDTWAKVKDGYFTGFSVGGFGIREVN